MNQDSAPPEAIAIIGMSGRFPHAANPDEFWQNLIAGKDCITRFGDRVEADGTKYVGARGVLENPDLFDAEFFGIYPKEAELMDPQHRIFLECAWECMEHAGYDPAEYPGLIGVFAGLSLNTYLLNNIGQTADLAENYQVGEYQKMLGIDKDFLPVSVSYKLNLRGPSMAIHTACSTSLVAICQAATALLAYQTDMAVAGAVSLSFPQERLYRFTEEGLASGDGTCRAFDEKACGTVFGHGCGTVLMKRLSEAVADGDPILAVIKGWAVNNDGSDKIGFAAPGLNAQADVIAMAQAKAGLRPWEISYIEAHGTATPLGDPIEVAALTKAFREGGATGNQFCILGTGKTHIGHLDVAAGVTGLIKTIQQFRHEKIPALLHFNSPNPHIDFAGSPFAPAAFDRDWPAGDAPRFAGVSAFGVGGTNAHVVVQEPPLPIQTSLSAKPQLLLLSAKTENSLNAAARNLAAFLTRENPSLADTAFTLSTARRGFSHRRAIVANGSADAIARLGETTTTTVLPVRPGRVAFLFPGQGSQYVDMTRGIYDAEPVFKAAIDECAELLRWQLQHDIRATLYPSDHERGHAEWQINQTWVTQPCIFAVEYALAKLFISWGIQPALLIGHSIGEYVAAVLAGTFTLPDALRLLATRARLMQDLPGGSMLAIRAGISEITLPHGIDLAAINSEKLCTVSGAYDALLAFQQSLESANIASLFLQTSHAFHSAAMEPITGTFTERAAEIPAHPPTIPWISTCTGQPVDAALLADPSYWSRQLRQPVLFTDSLATAFAGGDLIVLEVGPGQALSQFARQHPSRANSPVISTLPSSTNDLTDLYSALGELWMNGVSPDWNSFYQGQTRARIHLPTYAFDRKSFWIDNSVAGTPMPQPPSVESEVYTPAPASSPSTAPAAESIPVSDPTDGLRALVLELSGIVVEDPASTFTELGFDSLFLTLASQAIQSRFGVKITFRQMLGEFSSVAAIARHIVATAPPIPAVEAIVATDHPVSSPPDSSGLTPVKWPARFSRTTSTSTRFGTYKPIEKGDNGGLTPQQQSFLDDLIARYVRKTPGSKAYAVEHRPHFADPRAASGFKSLWKEMVYPIVSTRSKASKVWDIDGNEYVDITMGFGVYLFGHSPSWLTAALETQLRSGIEIGPQSLTAGKLAKAIAELVRMDRVTFCNTGSEAVMAAMRLARTVTGRQRIAYFTGAYHGMFEEVLVRGSWVDGVYKAQPVAPGIPRALVENMLVLDYADPSSLEILRAHAHELAAVMIEPVQSRAPGSQPREFMQRVREITKQSGTALIFDEVVTGFRCAPGGAQAYFGIEADMATYGKVVGGGIPIGVLAGKREYMDALDGGAWNYGDDSFPEAGVTFFAGTFVRHPLALAAAWSVVGHLMEEGPRLQIELAERVGRFCRTLNDHFAATGVPVRLPHFTTFAVIDHAPDLKHAGLFWYLLRTKGVHIWEGRPMYFTTAHTDEDLDLLLNAFVESAAEMQAAGFFPASGEKPTVAPKSFPRFDIAPTTEAQREIFHAVQMGDDANCSFNESNIIRIDGPLDVPALKAALNDVVVRHPALRSTIAADGETQLFHPSDRSLAIMEHNFASAADGDGFSPASALPLSLLKLAESSTPFDLTNGPLIRVHLVRLSSQRHELLFTAHHIVCDGWSFGMIVAELATCYNARKAGRLPVLPPAMSFADFARNEAKEVHSPESISAEEFWVAKFSETAPVLELPVDRPRPQAKSYQGGMESITLDPDRYSRLKSASPKLGGTLFATLLATFATLLHRLTGQEDIVIGVPAAGQTRIGRDELIGHCLNFLPLRLRPTGETPFAAFANDIKEQVLEAYDHRNYTFYSLLKKIKFERDPSRNPLVSVMFNIDKSGIDHLSFDDLKIDVATNPKQFVNFDLFFNLAQTNDQLVVECEYNTDLHDAATIRRWLAAFEQLIESAIEEGNRSLATLPLLGEEERTLTMETWNATSRDYPDTATIHGLFASVSAAAGEDIAVRCGDETLTYAELDQRATALAGCLQAAGVVAGDLVGIHLERSATMVAGLLAVFKCGAAYVPMDPSFPTERIRFMIEDAHMKVIVSQSSIRAELPASGAIVVLVDEPMRGTSPFSRVVSQPSDIAYVIFTSGSTGRPKGVRIPHRAVVNFLNSMRREPGLTAEDVLLSVTTLSFDISVLEIFLPLVTGAQLVVADRETARDFHLLSAAIARYGITFLQATPATFRMLLETGWSGKSELKILIGGEAVPRDLVNRLAPLCREIWNVYGPTETTIWSTAGLLSAGDGPVSIGRPIDNTRVFIIGAAMQPQPVGVPGELLIGGLGLAEGYHERPDLTADRFIDSPFDSGGKLYRTGDLARWNSSGNLECLGRLDHQVKVRGFRIELGEIESTLEKHPAVGQAIATVHEGAIAAYVRCERDPSDDGTAIWKNQWDMLYSSAIEQSGGKKLDRLDSVIAGWTGVEGVEGQVTEWIDTTVTRIRKYEESRIFEIGCGTGQILARLAPLCEVYWAADISKVAIEALEKSRPQPHVKLLHRPADDFSDIAAGFFDTVIINSVAQYFPSGDYLADVLENAARTLRPGGRIFLGDIQSNVLLETYHAEDLAKRAPEGTTVSQLREKIARRLASESELSFDPDWFALVRERVPAISRTEILLRRGKLSNETTTYHYDVILHVGNPPRSIGLPPGQDWKNLNLEQLEAILSERSEPIHLTGIPDARLAPALALKQALAATSPDAPIPRIPGAPSIAVSAEDLFTLAETLGFTAHIRWQSDGSDGLLEAAIIPATAGAIPDWPARILNGSSSAFVNTPSTADAESNLTLAATLRTHLALHLPDYMIPSTFTVLEVFPLTPDGKIDRKALPVPAKSGVRETSTELVAPRDEAERTLADIWKQVLGKSDISIHDDIFELGGDSILIFQIATRAGRAGLTVTPAQIFRLRNIAAIAAGS